MCTVRPYKGNAQEQTAHLELLCEQREGRLYALSRNDDSSEVLIERARWSALALMTR
jgi:hypothetical protein